MENSITKHNKDLISKILADTFGNKSFEVYGIHLPPIRQYLQTDFPDVQVTDRISDRFFLLADGSYALVDFEAEYRLSNKVKYLRYITRVLEHHLNRNNPIRLRFIVIYMGNVKSAPADYKTDCLTIHTEQAFLSHIDGDTEYQKILDKLDAGILLTDEDLMRIIILPLTYSRKEDQIRMVDHMIDTAIQIVEDEKRAFVLAGICIASDTFMSVTQAKRIGGILRMTRVGRMLQEEFDQLEAMIEEKKAQLVKQEEQL
ncbi:MAG: hypothetical protein Q4D81_06420, partial [Eubacteriales bacterium]|nr:hypothetical protein [Eubacteriales bacterium]